MVCIAVRGNGGTDDCIYMPRSRLDLFLRQVIFLRSHPRENRDASIPVAVSVIISIVMVPMMVPVPPLPPVFVGVTVVAVAVFAVVVRSVWLVSGANVNSNPIVCFRPGGYQSNQPERRQTQKEMSFHIIIFLFRRKRITLHAALRFGSGSSLTILEHAGFPRIGPSPRHWQLINLYLVS